VPRSPPMFSGWGMGL